MSNHRYSNKRPNPENIPLCPECYAVAHPFYTDQDGWESAGFKCSMLCGWKYTMWDALSEIEDLEYDEETELHPFEINRDARQK